jgi:glutamate synthase (NADPH/NADH) small chain
LVKFFVDVLKGSGDILGFVEGGSMSATLTPAQIAANFADSHPRLTPAQALVEANRCYFCYDAPCVEACPTEIDVPGFIRGIATGNMAGAAKTILEANIFGGSCARVCPTEILCERACVRNEESGEPIRIGALQRVATDWQIFGQQRQPFARAPRTGRKIAVVGAGPAGLSCAHALAMRGHDVTVYDEKPKPGGLNEYGIAAYKMVDDFAAREVAFITSIGGISIEYLRRLGDTLLLEDLRERFDAVFLGIGLRGTNRLGVEGEDLPGVRDAVEFIAELRQALPNAPAVGKRVVVIGGGNTAIDAATQARLLGAEEVTMLYRRGPEQMSATMAEQDWAKRNGVNIRYWSAPLKIAEARGALSVTTERAIFAADLVLKAVGQKFLGDGLAVENGRISVDESYQTSVAGVFAGGDCTAGIDLTVHAVQDGKRAAAAIDEYVRRRHG